MHTRHAGILSAAGLLLVIPLALACGAARREPSSRLREAYGAAMDDAAERDARRAEREAEREEAEEHTWGGYGGGSGGGYSDGYTDDGACAAEDCWETSAATSGAGAPPPSGAAPIAPDPGTWSYRPGSFGVPYGGGSSGDSGSSDTPAVEY